ncbi:hypothetical protein KI387_043189 [Taxus chinensis]|uniref:Uncharacterized protein n=1 Tax=Taxus chinensis TaxID=29808 RepID=A0AA38BZU1_TAXCH|nr:hypothetical protein KI387_043189 [Taxus chinensis]
MPKEGDNSNDGNHDHGAVSLNIEKVSEMNSNTAKAKDKKKEENNKVVPFHKLFVTADSLDKLLMTLGTIGAVANGVSIPLMTILFGGLINAFGENSTDGKKVMSEVSKIALEFVYLACGAGVASFLQVSCWMCTGERQATRIRSLYLKTILRQDIGFFDSEASTGEVIGRMSGDTILIQEAMGEKVGKFIQFITTFLAGIIVAFIKGWKLTLVMLSMIPLLVVSGGSMAMIISKMSSRGQQAYAEAANIVEQTIGSIRMVASFTGEKKSIEGYDKSLAIAYKAITQQGLVAGVGLGSVLFIMFCGYALALWYGSRLILDGSYTGGDVINVIFAVLMGGMSLGQTSPSLNAFGAGRAAAYKMFETIDRKPEIDVFDKSGLVLEDIQGDIELKDVRFTYPARPDVQIFSGFSLEIPRGTTAALVGESGSGKSTVISLIERFYDPQAGEVLIDGINIKKFQLKWIRQKIGLVSQEPVLFATTIKENLLYGKDGATVEEIKAAAELANAAKFINKLPQGFDTMVGEHGTQLSGGQKQRIAIARAILKDPRILLLDEATSALDTESERVVQEALDRIMVNRTTVIVAHRLTTVRNADMIAVVQCGSIVEKVGCLIVAPTQMYCFAIAGGRLVQRIRSLTFSKVVYQEIGWFDDNENSSGAISARLSTDAATVRSLVGDALSLVVQNIATIIAGIVISFTANWLLALLILAIVPLLGLQGYMQVKFMNGFTADAKLVYEEASQVANDAVGSIRTVASFCAEDKVFFALSMAAVGISQSAGLSPDLAKAKSSINSVFKILDRASKIDANDESGTTLDNVKGDIEFQHVSFKYPTRPDVQIFRDLCLFVHSGKTVALVGESGSGKSTAIALLERFYDPDSGRIFLDGVEIRQLQLKWLRQQMGLVSQEPVLFNDTIRANIAYGKEGTVTDEQIIAAAEAANAHNFISSLPQGYNTTVGERGVQLSGGQKQRIAIARAVLKDPRILLLDEATSALDAESECIVQDALDSVMVNRSTIVIAHRLSTIKDADLIAVVKNGKIAEQGKHDDLLLKRNGAYASLVQLQKSST